MNLGAEFKSETRLKKVLKQDWKSFENMEKISTKIFLRWRKKIPNFKLENFLKTGLKKT